MAPKPSDSAERLRAAGNQSFRNGQFAEAAALYSRALQVMQEQGTRLAPVSSARAAALSVVPDPDYPELALCLPSWGFLPPRPTAHRRSHRPSRPFPALGVLPETSLALAFRL